MKRSSLLFYQLFLAIILSIILIFSNIPQSSAEEDTTLLFQLSNPYDESFSYTLNVIVPHSLNEYYQNLSHVCWFDYNYAKFVTPYALQPIADCLRQIYTDDESFTNQVLTLVHQISYEITAPVYYPVETLAMKKGDCDLFSLTAASILKAGGLDVVLLRYLNESHMNIGVHLNQTPHNTRTQVFSVKYENTSYYIAECTSTNWQNSWRVGECPINLQNASVVIINTTRCEQEAPGQVIANIQNSNITSPTKPLPPTPIPITPNVPTLTPPSTPILSSPNLTHTPIPSATNPSPQIEKSPTPKLTKTPSSTPNFTSTKKPIPTSTQTNLPLETSTPTSPIGPEPSTDTNKNPTSNCTLILTSTDTAQYIKEQNQIPEIFFIIAATAISIIISTVVMFLIKRQNNSNKIV